MSPAARKTPRTNTRTTSTRKTAATPAAPGRKLRIAFIGAGGIAGMHMDLLSGMPDVELVALADVNTKGMAAHAEKYKISAAHCYSDWKTMLKAVRPDAVSVCTPNGLHAPATIDALKAGAHVIVEKPMAMNAKEAQAMVDAAKKHGRKLVIGFQFRYSPKTQYLKKAVDEGVFGKVLYARVQALRRRGIPNWGVFGRKELQGGGPMIDIGVHAMEAAHYTMGSPRPVAAVGQTFTYMGNRQAATKTVSQWPNWDWKTYNVEDLAVGQIRFDNGAVMSIEASFVAHIQENNILNFWLMGEKAGCQWSPSAIYTDAYGHMVNATPAYQASDDFKVNFGHKLRNFVDHCLKGTPSMAPAEHGLMVQKMLDGIYRSAGKGGAEVRID